MTADSKSEKAPICPHCQSAMPKISYPGDQSTWGVDEVFICLNDECSYFVNGWKRMKEKYQKVMSYRYMINPINGKDSSQPVWSRDALKDRIIEE